MDAKTDRTREEAEGSQRFEEAAPAKKTYTTPTLTVHGDATKVTQFFCW